MYRNKSKLTIFEDEADGVDQFTADQHDGVVPWGGGEVRGLAAGLQVEPATLVQELLAGRGDVGPSEQNVLKQGGSVGSITITFLIICTI